MIFNIKVEVEDRDEVLSNLEFKTKENDKPESPYEIYGFNDILNVHRNKIDKIHTDIWKKVRWYINEYDFLVKDPIINRAFYKYWEIINVFEVFDKYNETDTIFHCPGYDPWPGWIW